MAAFDVQVFVAPRLDIEALSNVLLQMAAMFLQWKKYKVSNAFVDAVPKPYRPQVISITNDIVAQGESFKIVVEHGLKQAAAGQRVAGDVVNFLEQLQSNIPASEARDLLTDLQGGVEELLLETKPVFDQLREVRQGLLKVRDHAADLGEHAHAQAMQAKQAAEDSSKKASAVGEALEEIWDWFWKFPPLAAVLLGAKKVQHLVVARRTEGKSHLLLGLALLTKVAGHLQRAERATQAADVFKELEGQISKAESAVGRHVEFWQVLNNKIQVAVLDPGRLLNAENGPKVAIVKKQRDAWIAISRMFEDYGSQNLLALDILRVA